MLDMNDKPSRVATWSLRGAVVAVCFAAAGPLASACSEDANRAMHGDVTPAKAMSVVDQTAPMPMAHDEHGAMPMMQHDPGAMAGAAPMPLQHHDHGAMGGDHSQHRAMMQQAGYQRSAHDYAVPDLALTDMNGRKTTLGQELATHKPVLLNFIYTTCTTICPILSATFSQVQQEMGSDVQSVRMISISIDPEQDTPQRLREYAQRFEAGSQWRFFTGELDNIIAVQKAFDIYRGAKTNHEPITFLRAAGAGNWVRIDGIASASEIIKEYQALAAPNE